MDGPRCPSETRNYAALVQLRRGLADTVGTEAGAQPAAGGEVKGPAEHHWVDAGEVPRVLAAQEASRPGVG